MFHIIIIIIKWVLPYVVVDVPDVVSALIITSSPDGMYAEDYTLTWNKPSADLYPIKEYKIIINKVASFLLLLSLLL